MSRASFHGAEQRVVVRCVLFDDVEITAGRKDLAACALDDDAVDRVVAVDVAPYVDQLTVHDRVRGVVFLGPVHRDAQHLGVWAIEQQALVSLLPIGHEVSSVAEEPSPLRVGASTTRVAGAPLAGTGEADRFFRGADQGARLQHTLLVFGLEVGDRPRRRHPPGHTGCCPVTRPVRSMMQVSIEPLAAK